MPQARSLTRRQLVAASVASGIAAAARPLAAAGAFAPEAPPRITRSSSTRRRSRTSRTG